MKRLVILLALLLLLVGCEKKEEEYVEEEQATVKEIIAFNRTYSDIKHMTSIGSEEEISLNVDNSVFYRNCVDKETCSFYTGTFEIKGEKLYITLTQQSRNNKWEDLKKKEVMEFDITDKNTFYSNIDGYEREFSLNE